MLIKADARFIPLRDKTVQCCVTSPPYWGLRDYGNPEQIGLEKTPEEYVSSILAVMRDVWRCLKDDGVLWLNLGDSYAAQRGGTSMPAETLAGGEHGESDYSVPFRGRVRHGGFQAHRDAGAIGLKHKDLVGIPWRVAFALQADGWYLRSDIIWSKPNPMPESVKDRPTKAHEYIFLLSKSERYQFNQDSIREKYVQDRAGVVLGRGLQPYSVARGNDRSHSGGYPQTSAGRNCRTVWVITSKPFTGSHFATFPREIPERCIKAGSRPGDVVLDPFCGSGTTVMVARDLGRIGIGLDLSYQDLSAERIGGSLFKGVVNSAWA